MVGLSSIDICVAIETPIGLISSQYVTLGIKKENKYISSVAFFAVCIDQMLKTIIARE